MCHDRTSGESLDGESEFSLKLSPSRRYVSHDVHLRMRVKGVGVGSSSVPKGTSGHRSGLVCRNSRRTGDTRLVKVRVGFLLSAPGTEPPYMARHSNQKEGLSN